MVTEGGVSDISAVCSRSRYGAGAVTHPRVLRAGGPVRTWRDRDFARDIENPGKGAMRGGLRHRLFTVGTGGLTILSLLVALASPAAAAARRADAVIDSAPPSLTASTTATFTFHSTITPATFTCRLDFGSSQACTSPRTHRGGSRHPHFRRVRDVTRRGRRRQRTTGTAQPRTRCGRSTRHRRRFPRT